MCPFEQPVKRFHDKKKKHGRKRAPLTLQCNILFSGSPFRKKVEEAEHQREEIQFFQFKPNPKCSKMLRRYAQLTVSKTLKISNFKKRDEIFFLVII
jgi:hypothetical protein